MNERIEARRAFYEAKPMERRLRPFEVRSWMDEAGVSALGLTGYASTTEDPYEVTDWLGSYRETICAGAFNKALTERDDVRLLVNHEGIPIARTKSGTMTLREDEHGLLVDVPNLDGDSPLVQTVRSAMQRGDVDEMSFAFKATRQEWNEDYTERFVREVKLYDVSVVTYPANAGTSVKLRGESLDEVVRRVRENRATASDVDVLTQALGWLNAIDLIVDVGQEAVAAHLGVPNPDDTTDAAMGGRADVAGRERRLAQLRTLASSL